MPQNPEYIPRIVNLTLQDYTIVRRLASEKGLGSKGFSAALRMIIREWSALQPPAPPSANSEPRPAEGDGTSPCE